MIELVCSLKADDGAIYGIGIEAISLRLIDEVTNQALSPYIKAVARGLLGIDGKPCPSANELRDGMKEELRKLAGVKTEKQ